MTKKKVKATTPARVRISKSVLDAKDARIKELSELNEKSAIVFAEQKKEISLLKQDFNADRADNRPKEVLMKLETHKAPSRNLMVNVDLEIIAKTNGIQDLKQLTLAETKKLTFVLKNLFQELKAYGE